jgi:hypothetical protein
MDGGGGAAAAKRLRRWSAQGDAFLRLAASEDAERVAGSGNSGAVASSFENARAHFPSASSSSSSSLPQPDSAPGLPLAVVMLPTQAPDAALALHGAHGAFGGALTHAETRPPVPKLPEAPHVFSMDAGGQPQGARWQGGPCGPALPGPRRAVAARLAKAVLT